MGFAVTAGPVPADNAINQPADVVWGVTVEQQNPLDGPFTNFQVSTRINGAGGPPNAVYVAIPPPGGGFDAAYNGAGSSAVYSNNGGGVESKVVFAFQKTINFNPGDVVEVFVHANGDFNLALDVTYHFTVAGGGGPTVPLYLEPVVDEEDDTDLLAGEFEISAPAALPAAGAVVVMNDGGYDIAVPVAALALPDGDYRVKLTGPKAFTCYSGVSGQGSIVRVRQGAAAFASPAGPRGSYDLHITDLNGVEKGFLIGYVILVAHELSSETFRVRQFFPPRMRTGPRGPRLIPFPQG